MIMERKKEKRVADKKEKKADDTKDLDDQKEQKEKKDLDDQKEKKDLDDQNEKKDNDDQLLQTFDKAGSGSSNTYPMQCSALRKGGHVLIKGRPCKIVDMSTSKTGKHGHAKINLVGIDIFTGKKLEDMSPSTHNMDVPRVERNDFPLLSIEDGFMSLLTNDGGTKDDIKAPNDVVELFKTISEENDKKSEYATINVTVLKAMDEEQAISWTVKVDQKTKD